MTPEEQTAYDKLVARNNVLKEALQAASEHLDYCNYGDKWERECAVSAGLPEKIEKALQE